ncbi:MAG TPA: hypothetical protein VKP11_12535, partial [Frankiaceae bacterium]|nr:hypothetical protein [Frankiaceae bacterium]
MIGSSLARRPSALLLAGLLAALVAGLPIGPATGAARAQPAGAVDRAAAALRGDPVYVDPAAEGAGVVDAGRVRQAVGGAPVVVAVLPAAARQEVGGDPGALPRAIGARVPGRTVVVLCGRSLRAGSPLLPAGRAGELAQAAQAEHAGAFSRDNVTGAL